MSHVHPSTNATNASSAPAPAAVSATAAANRAAARSAQRQATQQQNAAGSDHATFSAEAQRRLAQEQAQGQPPPAG